MSKPRLEFDGGFIMVPSEQFNEGVEWYQKHMGWTLIDTALTPIGWKAFFRLPGGGQANLKSFEMEHPHFTSEQYEEGNCRFCFSTADLKGALAYFRNQGVECSEPIRLPDGQVTVDIKAFAGVRITLSEDPESAGQFPDSRVIRFGTKPLWLGVKDLDSAIEWYEKVLGFKCSAEDYRGHDFALLGDGEWDYLWLQQIEPAESSEVILKANPGAKVYFVVRDRDKFLEMERSLRAQGIETTEPVGERWMGFHFYDPDGNRLNVWNYY